MFDVKNPTHQSEETALELLQSHGPHKTVGLSCRRGQTQNLCGLTDFPTTPTLLQEWTNNSSMLFCFYYEFQKPKC